MLKRRIAALMLVSAWTSAWSAMPAPLLGGGACWSQWNRAATELQAALECRLRLTASDTVRSALGMTNARIGGRYVLPAGLSVFDRQVREVALDDGFDSGSARYGAWLPDRNLTALARAAGLVWVNGVWQRRTSFGQLSARVTATGVWLECREVPGTSGSERR